MPGLFFSQPTTIFFQKSRQKTHVGLTLAICKVGESGAIRYQNTRRLKRDTALEFTTVTPILHIYC